MRNAIALFTLLTALTAASIVTADDRASYVWKRSDGTSTITIHGSLDELGRLKNQWGSEYVWTRQANGTQYVITDRAVLNEIAAAHADLDAAEIPMREAEARMRPHEREMNKIERRLDAVSDQLDDEDLPEAEREELERKMQAIEEEMDAAEKKMEVVEREMERLETIVDREADKAEKKFEEIVDRAIRDGRATRID
jgi:chromosome segregation ATPase